METILCNQPACDGRYLVKLLEEANVIISSFVNGESDIPKAEEFLKTIEKE